MKPIIPVLCLAGVVASSAVTGNAAAQVAPTTSVAAGEGDAQAANAARDRTIHLWRQAAEEAQLEPEFIEATARLTDQACAKVADPHLSQTDAQVRESLRNLIQTIASPAAAREPSGSYWVAYCIAEALARPVADDPEMMAKVVDEHLKLFDEATANLSAGLLDRIPPDHRDGWAKKLDGGKATLRETVLSRITALQRDVLFPAFKRPLDEKMKTDITRRLKPEAAFPEFRNTKDLRNVDDLVERGIANFFKIASDLSLYGLSAPQIEARLTPTKYWGYMLYRGGIVYRAVWPISITLGPDGEMNEAWKDHLPAIMQQFDKPHDPTSGSKEP